MTLVHVVVGPTCNNVPGLCVRNVLFRGTRRAPPRGVSTNSDVIKNLAEIKSNAAIPERHPWIRPRYRY